mgnify:CR=1 FL=1
MAATPKTTWSAYGVKVTAEGAEQVKLLNDLLKTKGLIKEGIVDYCKVHKLKCDVL